MPKTAQSQTNESPMSKKGSPKSVYFFYGKEDFLVDEAVLAVKDTVFKADDDADLNYSVFFAKDPNRQKPLTLSDILVLAQTLPMFSEKRLIVVRDFDDLKKETGKEKQKAIMAEFAQFLASPPAFTVLVFIAGELDKKDLEKEPYSLLKPFAKEYASFKEADAAGFAQAHAKRLGWSLSPEATQKLILFVGTAARDIDAELRKIILYIGERPERVIRDSDVLQVVGVSKEYNIFELQRALVTKDLRQTSGMMLMMMEKDTEPLAVTSFLTGYFLKLWKLKQPEVMTLTPAEVSKEIGLFGGQSYFLNDYKSAAERFTISEIETAVAALCDADKALKGIGFSQPDDKQIMLTLMSRILPQHT